MGQNDRQTGTDRQTGGQTQSKPIVPPGFTGRGLINTPVRDRPCVSTLNFIGNCFMFTQALSLSQMRKKYLELFF